MSNRAKDKVWSLDGTAVGDGGRQQEWTTETSKLKDSQLSFPKKLFSNGYLVCDSIYMTFLKRQKYSDREQTGRCQELRMGKNGDYRGITIWSLLGVMEFVLLLVGLYEFTCVKILTICLVWWHTPAISAPRGLRHEDCEYKASLSYTVRTCLKK
jgi:hypothetical protein